MTPPHRKELLCVVQKKYFRDESENERQKRRARGTMVEFRWIKASLYLLLVLQFTALTEQQLLSFVVREGDDVTLPCENVVHEQSQCEITYWTFSDSKYSAVDLVDQGHVSKDAETKSDRLSVTEFCSLVVKNITAEDAGQYNCRQFRSEQQLRPDALVLLSVVTMTEQKVGDEVTLTCSVFTHTGCRRRVKWLLRGSDVDKDNKDLKTSQSGCSASVSFKTSHFIYTSQDYGLLRCEVKDGSSEELFTFSPQSSGEKQREYDELFLIQHNAFLNFRDFFFQSRKKQKSMWKQRDNIRGTDRYIYFISQQCLCAALCCLTEKKAAICLRTDKPEPKTLSALPGWWWWIVVAVGSAALLVTVVVLIRWRRNKGNETQTDENKADPEEGVSYTSISFTNQTNSKGPIRGGGDAVTYSAVKAPSADPSNLYATVN
ncbi:uncharacterized protein [Trachinotus anak]|uniref:uncharacterized protein isoform X1 n=1 Tax=Trachinotus anak TaxID=443729 RepID=UPI0039F1AC7A